MCGKIIKLNDYEFKFGQETVYLNVYALFKSKKSGNKYVIYSYDNKKLYSGSAFLRNNEVVVMVSKSELDSEIEDFVKKLLVDDINEDYELISLDKVNSVQVIDEKLCDFDVDINKLFDITIPKPEIKMVEEPKKKRSAAPMFFVLFVVVVAAFFFFNPEVINGKNVKYICNKTYNHEKLPASVNEKIEILFNGKGKVQKIDVKCDYVFNDVNYYKEFRDKSYFYQYFTDGDTYKFDDSTYTYKLFSSIDTNSDFFLPTSENQLIKYYQENNYTCKVVQE